MSDRLASYKRKRDFEATPEPRGGRGDAAGELPRFVVQEHHATRLHWDLRLEHDGALASWAIPNGIPEDPKQNRKAVRTEDHPLEYLDFHGEIPKGSYGAGTMTIWDRGTYEVHKFDDKKVEVTFHGERLRGRYGLFPAGKDPKDWMIHRMDPPADLTAVPMPDQVAPMLATAGPLPPDDGAWAFEIKWDGVRAIAHSEPGRLKLLSRNLNDITARYPELSKLNRALSSHRAILDGEVIALGPDGTPSFGALQGRMHLTGESQIRRLAQANPVSYVIFDLLWLDGHSLMREPLSARRARLAELELDGERWTAPEFVVGKGAEVLAASRAQGLEGIVAKRLDGIYEPGRRSRSWIKVKNVRREDVWIGGWMPMRTHPPRRRERIGALLVGLPDGEGALRYAGRVGTGFTEDELARLAAQLGPLEAERSPFSGSGVPKAAVFVAPVLKCCVEFVEWTREGRLRAPSYKGLVEEAAGPVMAKATPVSKSRDKAVEVEIEGRTVRVSNPDKVLYPQTGFTKSDLVDYFTSIAPVLLPHLEGRMLTLKRYPNGVEGAHFYEKNCPKHRPDWVATEHFNGIDFCVVRDAATLVWLANLADIELHTSLARARTPDRPTTMVFDLDPGAPATIVECCQVGLWLQGMFERLGLEAFAKTSGSKGLQVYVPLNSDVTYDQTKPFSKAVAELLGGEAPELVVSRQLKDLRAGKVLVDWSQNDEHKTTANVYSTRAKDRPTVSTPVTWDEVRACHEAGDAELLTFTTEDVLRRVTSEGDLFAPVVSLTQRLPKL